MKFKNLFLRLSSKEKGEKAENLAISYLVSKGFKIIEKNFRTSFGEIDIIAQKNSVLVFVEVKSEFSNNDFFAEEKVNFKKKEKIFKVAEYFLLKNLKKLSKIKGIRFDVIIVKGKTGEIIHYESAFYKEECFTRY